jgi:hypothetical protein
MIKDDIDAIKTSLDAGPTPGPWKYAEGTGFDYGSKSYGVSAPSPHHWVVPTLNIPAQDAAYIAACSPDRIARIVEHVERLEKVFATFPILRAALEGKE